MKETSNSVAPREEIPWHSRLPLGTIRENARRRCDQQIAVLENFVVEENEDQGGRLDQKIVAAQSQYQECKRDMELVSQVHERLSPLDNVSLYELARMYSLVGIELPGNPRSTNPSHWLPLIVMNLDLFFQRACPVPRLATFCLEQLVHKIRLRRAVRPPSTEEHETWTSDVIAQSMSRASLSDIQDQLRVIGDQLLEQHDEDTTNAIIWKTVHSLYKIHYDPSQCLKNKGTRTSFEKWMSTEFGPPPRMVAKSSRQDATDERLNHATAQANMEAYKRSRQYRSGNVPVGRIAAMMMDKYFTGLIRKHTGAKTRSGQVVLTKEWKKKRDSIRNTLNHKLK